MDSPSRGPGAERRLPPSITTGGKTRTVTQYLRDNARPGITAYRVGHTLDQWLVRGVRTEEGGRQSIAIWLSCLG